MESYDSYRTGQHHIMLPLVEHQNLNPTSSDAYNLTADSLEELADVDKNRVQDLVRVIGYGLSKPKKLSRSPSMMSTPMRATTGNWLLSSHSLFQVSEIEFESSEGERWPLPKRRETSRWTLQTYVYCQ